MKTYTYSYQNGPCRGASTDAGEFGRVPEGTRMHVPGVGAGVCGRRRIWPGTRPQYVPGQTWQASLTPPQGMNDHTRGRVFATDGGARWGVCNTPLHGYPPQQTNGPQGPNKPTSNGPHRPEWMNAGYDRPPRTGSFGRAYAIRPYPAGRRAFGYPAKFAGVRRHPAANAERLARLAQTPR